MLRKIRIVVLGALMAGLLCYGYVGANDATAYAGGGCSRSADSPKSSGPQCGAQKGKTTAAPFDIEKELGLTAEQKAKVEQLKADCDKSGEACSPACFEKMKAILTPAQADKLHTIIERLRSGCNEKH